MGLAPRYEQAPPCNRTLGSSGWKGSSPPSYSVTSGVPCLPLWCRGLGEEMQLHPASCSSPEVPHFPSSWSKHREFYLCSVRHLWSTGRNWGNSPQMDRGGSPSEQDTPSLPPVLVSWEPRESEQQKYQRLGPLEKGPGWG